MQERYATIEEARAGHLIMVAAARKALKKWRPSLRQQVRARRKWNAARRKQRDGRPQWNNAQARWRWRSDQRLRAAAAGYGAL